MKTYFFEKLIQTVKIILKFKQFASNSVKNISDLLNFEIYVVSGGSRAQSPKVQINDEPKIDDSSPESSRRKNLHLKIYNSKKKNIKFYYSIEK